MRSGCKTLRESLGKTSTTPGTPLPPVLTELAYKVQCSIETAISKGHCNLGGLVEASWQDELVVWNKLPAEGVGQFVGNPGGMRAHLWPEDS